jgi:hypothetical protein
MSVIIADSTIEAKWLPVLYGDITVGFGFQIPPAVTVKSEAFRVVTQCSSDGHVASIFRVGKHVEQETRRRRRALPLIIKMSFMQADVLAMILCACANWPTEGGLVTCNKLEQ